MPSLHFLVRPEHWALLAGSIFLLVCIRRDILMPKLEAWWVVRQFSHGAGPEMTVETVWVCGSCGRRRESFLVGHDPKACKKAHEVPI